MPAVDRALGLLERRRLSATELRILLAVVDREVSVSELADAFGRRPLEIRRAAARLYARGLLRWRHDAMRREAVFAITPAGLATVRPLLTAAGAGT
jgi:DNA-binding MarR family transcriptional regulator